MRKLVSLLVIYDLIIIGGGPAAITAGIYAARAKLKTLLVAKSFGGQLIESWHIDNYPAVPEISGVDLLQRFVGHLKQYEKSASHGGFDLEIKEGLVAKNIKQTGHPSPDGSSVASDNFEVHANGSIFETRSIIIATGKAERKLDIPGAKEFEGKGISYCATCDAPIFRDKIVAVIGAGDAGQDTAWQLKEYAKKVYLLNRYNEMRGDDKALQEKLKNDQKVEILYEVNPKEILGEVFVKKLIYENLRGAEQKQIDVDGIFVEIGSIPATAFINGLLRCNDKGEIVVDHNSCATSVPGIFAAGDVTDVAEKQIIIAAGMGARAALSVYNYLKNK